MHFGSTRAWGRNAEIYFKAKNFTTFTKLRPKFENVGFTFHSDHTDLGSFTISSRNWHVIMRGRARLEVSEMLAQSQLPTRIHMSGAWVRVPVIQACLREDSTSLGILARNAGGTGIIQKSVLRNAQIHDIRRV